MKRKLLAISIALLMLLTINISALGVSAPKKSVAIKKKVVVKKTVKAPAKKKQAVAPAAVKSMPAKKATKPADKKTDASNAAPSDQNAGTDTKDSSSNSDTKVTISNIDDITSNIIVKDAFSLPQTVKALLSDSTTTEEAVVWDNTVNTDQVGTYTYSGKVEGYDKSVKLTLTVNPKPLTITSIEKLQTKEIKQDDQYTLPKTVSAVMSDGSKSDVEVAWDKPIDVSHLGLNKFVGTVNGYSKTLNFNVLIRGKDLGKPTEVAGEAQVGDIVGTKGSIQVDGFGKIDYEHFGIYIGDGKVIEFSSTDGTIPSAKITLNPMSKSFSNYFIYKLDPKDVKFTPEEIVKRANQELGKGGYDLIGNNCEHFAVWCLTDVHKSFQIDGYSKELIETADSLLKTVKGLY